MVRAADPTVAGTVTDVSPIASFRAGLDEPTLSSFLDVTADLTAGGSSEFSPSEMDEIFGAQLPDGSHTLHLQAADDMETYLTSSIFRSRWTRDRRLSRSNRRLRVWLSSRMSRSPGMCLT